MKTIFRWLFTFAIACSIASCTTESINENSSSTDVEHASSLNVQLGLHYLQQDNMSRAKQKILLAVKQNPSPQSYGALAYFYEQTKETPQAEKYYLKAIAKAPSAGAGHNNYGAFLCRQKQYKLADKQFMLAVNDPNYLNDAGAYENAGLCALLIPDNTKAIAYFQKAIQQNPRMSVSLQQLSKLSYEQGQFQQANIYMQQYIKSTNISADGLLLGVRIASKLNNVKAKQEYGFLLKTNFPKSKQYQQFLQQ